MKRTLCPLPPLFLLCLGSGCAGAGESGLFGEEDPAAAPDLGLFSMDISDVVASGSPTDPNHLTNPPPFATRGVRQGGVLAAPGTTQTRAALETDYCDDDTYIDQPWQSVASAHFVAHYLPDTAAEKDIEEILSRREQAYQGIRTALGVEAEPIVDIYLSPSRIAARAHGLAGGRAYPAEQRYEVVYTGSPDSYEVRRPGHELTHVLAYQLDPDNPYRLGILSEGLAEYLDQSDRDLHDAYARMLNAGLETRSHIASFDDRDVWGQNYGRAGSLTQFLVERYGMEAFAEIYRAASVVWSQGCFRHPGVGCINSPESIAGMLDSLLQQIAGESWSDVQPQWAERVRAALAETTAQIEGSERREIERVLHSADAAITAKDAAAYRGTIEGFYCDWGGEAVRAGIAGRAVSAYEQVDSEVVAIYPTGVKNFRSAFAVLLRHEDRGAVSADGVRLERFPVGWRVTWSSDWK